MDVTFVVIDDNKKVMEHGLIFSIEDEYKNVKFFSNPEKGLNYIKENLESNLIVLLDIQFSEKDKLDGHSLLQEIYKLSALIPVILWSAINQRTEEFDDFINNRAFGFLSKTTSIKEAMPIINKAYIHLENSLDNTIEDWIINSEKDKNKVIYISIEGESYSLNDLLREIRNQTEVGKEFSKKLNALTIDLLLRKKETL